MVNIKYFVTKTVRFLFNRTSKFDVKLLIVTAQLSEVAKSCKTVKLIKTVVLDYTVLLQNVGAINLLL